jgi:hypothetical protein
MVCRRLSLRRGEATTTAAAAAPANLDARVSRAMASGALAVQRLVDEAAGNYVLAMAILKRASVSSTAVEDPRGVESADRLSIVANSGG